MGTMIPLNSRQGLPPNAFWYLALRSLAAALFLTLIGMALQSASSSPYATCRGLLCGHISGGHAGALIYLVAAFLVVNATLRFKWFSFVLTEKNISINSGVFFQSSCTIRFDRIQDVNTIRNPLHMILGLASVAIWTASPDQRVGRVNRPDGLIVLTADSADWLKEYLSEPRMAGDAGSTPSGSRQAAGGAQAAPRGSAGIVLTLILAAAIALGFLMLRRTSTVTAPAASAAPSATTSSETASVGTPARAIGKQQIAYTTSCAVRKAGGAGGMRLCADLKEGGRCAHEADFQSHPTQEPAVLAVVNRSEETVKFYWLDLSGERSLYASLPPGGHVNQQNHIGAYWLISTADNHCIGIFSASTKSVGIF